MKRFFTVMMAVVMLIYFSMNVFATTTNGDDTEIDVKAVYSGGVTTSDVISVDVAWGSMEFTYTVGGTKKWDATKHEYTINDTAEWSASGNTVSLTNHSNVAVKVDLKYESDSAYNSVTGSFDKAVLNLATGENTTYDNAPKATATLTLGGKLGEGVTTLSKVGKITVQIGKDS